MHKNQQYFYGVIYFRDFIFCEKNVVSQITTFNVELSLMISIFDCDRAAAIREKSYLASAVC